MKQKFTALILTIFLSSQIFLHPHETKAANAGSVIINEIAWAGSVDNTNDEWIELYNTTSQSLNLDGWTIHDDQGTSIYQLSGNIAAHGYYLIEDSENSVTPTTANTVINLSLANTGDSLVLFDNNNSPIDAVNSSGGAWAAGNATNKASMERIQSSISGDEQSNWASSTHTSSSKSSGGNSIIGTPGTVNNVTQNQNSSNIQKVWLEIIPESLAADGNVKILGKTENAQDILSYGLELHYDPALLSFITASKGPFLSQSETKETSFQFGLQNDEPGTLLIAESITSETKTGTSGSGNLFELEVKLLTNEPAELQFAESSFVSNSSGDISIPFEGTNIEATDKILPISNAEISEGVNRYSLTIQWAPSLTQIDQYKLYRKSSTSEWKLLEQLSGQTDNETITFTDHDTITNGGKIVPFVEYQYRIIPIQNNIEGPAIEITGKETRGLKGDNNRSDRVDGRDLENLARHFGETSTSDSFSPLIDTNYDGQIDGSDLIDLGANFAKTYQTS